jgi:hypothetical protein
VFLIGVGTTVVLGTCAAFARARWQAHPV